MTARAYLRPAPAGMPPWCVTLHPTAYDEAGRVQLRGMPGVTWQADGEAPNGRGYYVGDTTAMRLVCDVLEAAGVLRVRDERPAFEVGEPFGYHVAPGTREYQREGIHWLCAGLAATGAAWLADDMGLGKSLQALAATDAQREGPVLVVCPAMVVRHWRGQIASWSRRSSGDYTILSYEGFAKAASNGTLPPSDTFVAVVWDEIHYLANPMAKRTKAAVAWLGPWRPTRPKLVALSGTPINAYVADAWQPLDLLWPGRFGRRWGFQERYCGGHFEEIPHVERKVWKADGATRLPELSARLADCVLRRVKADVGDQLPSLQRNVREVELPRKAAKDLKRAAAAIDWGAARIGVASLLSDIEAHKIDAAVELAHEVMAGGGNPLIITTRVATAHELGRRLGCPVVTGESVAADDRKSMLDGAACGVATIGAVTVGIDLVTYDTVIFVGLDWLPSRLLQAESRIHRLGQLRACTAWYLIGVGTLDEIVRQRVIERLDTFAAVMGGKDGTGGLAHELAGGYSEDDLLDQLAALAKGA